MNLKICGKTIPKKYRWLLIPLCSLVVSVIIVLLLLHKPSRFTPIRITDRTQMSQYLTNDLLPQLYNGIQLQEPFNLIVTQKGINDIITRHLATFNPDKSGQIDTADLSAPIVFFEPDRILLMEKRSHQGREFIITLIVKPRIDSQGLLNLRLANIKIGALNSTALIKLIARKRYSSYLDSAGPDEKDQLRSKITASLLLDKPFEPVFEIEGKKLRLKKITIKKEKLKLNLTPVFD